MKKFQFNGEWWQLVRSRKTTIPDANGDVMKGKTLRRIRVRPRNELYLDHFQTKEEEELYTLVHEAMHAMQWDLDEEAIVRNSKDLTVFLWQLGYRQGLPNSQGTEAR